MPPQADNLFQQFAYRNGNSAALRGLQAQLQQEDERGRPRVCMGRTTAGLVSQHGPAAPAFHYTSTRALSPADHRQQSQAGHRRDRLRDYEEHWEAADAGYSDGPERYGDGGVETGRQHQQQPQYASIFPTLLEARAMQSSGVCRREQAAAYDNGDDNGDDYGDFEQEQPSTQQEDDGYYHRERGLCYYDDGQQQQQQQRRMDAEPLYSEQRDGREPARSLYFASSNAQQQRPYQQQQQQYWRTESQEQQAPYPRRR